MLVKDTQTQDTHKFMGSLEANRDLVQQATNKSIENAALATEVINDPKKAGHWLDTIEFEKRLKKLLPNCRFKMHPTNEGKRVCYLNPNSKDEWVVYEWPRLPERSIREVIKKKMTLPGLIGNSKPQISRADLPDHEVIPHTFNPDGSIKEFGKIVWGSDLRAGQVYVDTPGGEVYRGWRTVLAKLVAGKYLTVTQVEKEFGSMNTPEWQKHMGKTHKPEVPW